MKILNYQKRSARVILVLAFFLFGFAAIAPAVKAAEAATFLIDSSYDIRGRASITATSRVTGLNAYYFVDDFYWDSKNFQEQNDLIANITALANEFDNVIYPKMHEFYGEEWTPGIDGDKKIYILLTDIKNDASKGSYGGYFSATNEYSKNLLDEYKQNQLEILEKEKKADLAAGKSIDFYAQKENEIRSIFTNEKELLYLNINFADKPNIKSFLAHEFQHMINWHQKAKIFNANEEIWLNEALSEYAPTALGYDNIYKDSALESTVNNFNRNPSDSLTEWKNTNQDYSTVSIFMQFLVGRYGTSILKSIITAPKTGIAAINDALQKIDPQASFSNVFSDWVVANYFNGQTIQNKKYGYANPNLNYENLHISATSSFMLYSNNMAKSSIAKSEENIKDWSGKWYQFISSPILSAPNQTLKISINANAGDSYFQAPYVIENIGGALTLNNFELRGNQNGNIYIDNFGTAVKSVTLMPISMRKISAFEGEQIPVKLFYIGSLILPNQPAIKSISPKTSALGNRTLVTIAGDNFAEGSIVRFGGVLATEINLIDSKTIIAKAPPFYKSGEVDVEIISPDLTVATAPKSFTYLAQAEDGSLIRAEGDYKVYVVKGKYKRWIQTEKIFGFYNFRWSDIITVAPETRDYYITSMLARADNDYKVYEIGSDGKKRHLSMSSAGFEASGRKWETIFIINDLEKNSYKTGAAIMK
ncbi:IPT/TIG domain-containing protein [Patescibacteria group bacterium]|nr:IPT/TIG domain-containing protein [Patescibacteria group bacterium]MBU4141941.1 IPT/TIG domain-containing protein [Patescibacteria group bacterium]